MLGYAYQPATAQVDGPALANSSTATSLLHAGSKFPLFPNFFTGAGQELLIEATGRISTLTAAPGTLTFDIRFGSVIVWNGGAMALNATAKTNVSWKLKVPLTIRAVGGGTACNAIGVGEWISEAIVGSSVPTTGGSGILLLPASTPAVGTGFDNTASQVVDLFATWQTANAANSIQLHQFHIFSPN